MKASPEPGLPVISLSNTRRSSSSGGGTCSGEGGPAPPALLLWLLLSPLLSPLSLALLVCLAPPAVPHTPGRSSPGSHSLVGVAVSSLRLPLGGSTASPSLSLLAGAAPCTACPKAKNAGGGRGSVGPPRLGGCEEAGTLVRLWEDLLEEGEGQGRIM